MIVILEYKGGLDREDLFIIVEILQDVRTRTFLEQVVTRMGVLSCI